VSIPVAPPAARHPSGRSHDKRPGLAAWTLALLSAASLSLPARTSVAAARVTQEYDLKAVFLLNFARFVDWPADAFQEAGTPIVIGVLGADPFGTTLQETVANESAHDRKVVVRHFRSAEEIEPCQILFVPDSESVQWQRQAGRLARRSMLTVGENREFTARAGMIAFDRNGRRLRLRINLAAVTAARLTISSKLLRQADIVASEDTTP
jgi:uncharacterized protein DUF4154